MEDYPKALFNKDGGCEVVADAEAEKAWLALNFTDTDPSLAPAPAEPAEPAKKK